MLEVPSEVRDHALLDLLKAYKSCFAKGEQFEIKYRTKKKVQSITVPLVCYKRGFGLYHQLFHKLRSAETLPKEMRYDFRITKDLDGSYYICIPNT